MANEDNARTQTAVDDESGVHRLRNIVVEEVSLVDRAANKRRFLVVKRSSEMADERKPRSRRGPRTGAGPATQRGNQGPKSDEGGAVDKARPRVTRAAEDEDDDEETEKARRSRPSEDDEDEDEDDDDETRKAADEGEGNEEEDEDEEESTPDKARPRAKARRQAGNDAPCPDGQEPGKRTRKAGDGPVLPAAVKNAVLRGLAQALERLMAIASQVKDADAPDDETDANVPGDLTDELEEIGELLEGLGAQLAEPAEKSRGKAPGTGKGRSAKAEVTKAGRRMAKDRLDRFQKALELLSAVLKELTEEKPPPTSSVGSAERLLGKRETPDVGQIVASVQALTGVVKRQEEQLVRMQKTRGTSNAIPVEGASRRREAQDVSWPLDMNRPISRDRVDKAISFYDEE